MKYTIKLKTLKEIKISNIFMFHNDYDAIRILYSNTDDIDYIAGYSINKLLERFKSYCGDILEIDNWKDIWYINPKKIYKVYPYKSYDNDKDQTDLYGCKTRNLANEYGNIRIHVEYKEFMKKYGHLLTFIESSI